MSGHTIISNIFEQIGALIYVENEYGLTPNHIWGENYDPKLCSRYLKTMQTYFDLLFGKEMQPLLDLFADDVNWFIVATGTTINGKDELKAGAQNAGQPHRIG
jgi:hypothetical protein